VQILDPQHQLFANDIKNTFNDWKYGLVNCHVDYFSDGVGQCHIYSIPFKMIRIDGVTHSFFGNCFRFVIEIRLYDVHPFEHIYFKWIACAVPLLKFLVVDNMTPPKRKEVFETMNESKYLIISFLRLIRVALTNAHMDYVELFLHDTKFNLPCLSSLEINYEKLVTVTNNFTSDLTRIKCTQLKILDFRKNIVYPEHFNLYFPLLE